MYKVPHIPHIPHRLDKKVIKVTLVSFSIVIHKGFDHLALWGPVNVWNKTLIKRLSLNVEY